MLVNQEQLITVSIPQLFLIQIRFDSSNLYEHVCCGLVSGWVIHHVENITPQAVGHRGNLQVMNSFFL